MLAAELLSAAVGQGGGPAGAAGECLQMHLQGELRDAAPAE